MLGRFLELSLDTPDIQASIEFYGRLGFSEARVGETWAHPYAVMTDGRVHLGLHQAALVQPILTFVKPEVLKQVALLEAHGIELAYRKLGNNIFNEVAWMDGDGHMLRLIEARTFSPAKRAATQTSRCGYFTAIALPCTDFTAGKRFWEGLGFVGMDEFDDCHPHVLCTSDFIDVGLYDPRLLRRPALRFEVEDMDATLGGLSARGVSPVAHAANRPPRSVVLIAPEGTPLIVATGRR